MNILSVNPLRLLLMLWYYIIIDLFWKFAPYVQKNSKYSQVQTKEGNRWIASCTVRERRAWTAAGLLSKKTQEAGIGECGIVVDSCRQRWLDWEAQLIITLVVCSVSCPGWLGYSKAKRLTRSCQAKQKTKRKSKTGNFYSQTTQLKLKEWQKTVKIKSGQASTNSAWNGLA